MRADRRPLFVHGTLTATRESVLSELKARFPHRREIRDRIYENGLIIMRPGGNLEAVYPATLEAAVRDHRGVTGYASIAEMISDIGHIG